MQTHGTGSTRRRSLRKHSRAESTRAPPPARPALRRYSDSTASNTDSCESDYTAGSTIHSRTDMETFPAMFRPRSANEPPVPAGFLCLRVSSEEPEQRCLQGSYSTEWLDQFVPPPKRRASLESQQSEHSGYVSSRAPSPRRFVRRTSTVRSDDLSDIEEQRPSWSQCRKPHFGRNSSANSSTVFEWSGLAHGADHYGSRESAISEYSGGYPSDVSPRSFEQSAEHPFDDSPNGRPSLPPAVNRRFATGQRRKSYLHKHVLEAHNEQETGAERPHSLGSSKSSGRSIADFVHQADQHANRGDDWDSDSGNELDASAEAKFRSRYLVKRSTVNQRKSARQSPALFIPPPTRDWFGIRQDSTSHPDPEPSPLPSLDLTVAEQESSPLAEPQDEELDDDSVSQSGTYHISGPYSVLTGEQAAQSCIRKRSVLARVKASLFS